jgi:hypothetical protein
MLEFQFFKYKFYQWSFPCPKTQQVEMEHPKE